MVVVVIAALVAHLISECYLAGCHQRWASSELMPTLKVAAAGLLNLTSFDFEVKVCFNWTFTANFRSKPLGQ